MRRRDVLRTSGALGIAGVAGCMGDGGGDGDGGGNGTTPQGTSSAAGEWPDLSGTKVSIVQDQGEKFGTLLSEIGSAFEEETNADVDIENVPSGQGRSRIVQLLQAGNPPELYSAGYAPVTNFINDGVAAPVTPAVESTIERYGEPQGPSMTFEGEHFMFPLALNAGQFWYRGDVIDREVSTWEEVLEMADSVHGTNGLTGHNLITNTSICTRLQFFTWLYAAGGKVTRHNDGTFESALDDEENRQTWIETLEFMKELHQYSPQKSGAGCQQWIQALPTGVSASATYTGARPKAVAIDQDKDFARDVDNVLMPTPEGQEPSTYVLSQGLTTFKDADSETANTFLDFMMQPEFAVDTAFIVPMHDISPWTGITELDGYEERLEELPEAWTQDQIEVAQSAAKGGGSEFTETEEPNPYAGSIASDNRYSNLTFRVLVEDQPVEEAVDQMHNEINESLSEAQE